MYKVVKDWFFTTASFVDPDHEKLESLGISHGEESVEEFRFKLSSLTSYNKSEKGLTTVDVSGFRIVLEVPFETFDEFFIRYIEAL